MIIMRSRDWRRAQQRRILQRWEKRLKSWDYDSDEISVLARVFADHHFCTCPLCKLTKQPRVADKQERQYIDHPMTNRERYRYGGSTW